MSGNNSSATHKYRRVLVTLRKIFVRSLLGIILLFLLIVGLIQFPAIQNYIKKKVVAEIAEKLQTDVRLGYIRINFAGNLVLEDLFIADRQQDTVIDAGKLKVALNPAGLLRKKIMVSNISLSETRFNYLILDQKGTTNIDFIINSFVGGEKEDKPKGKTPWDIQVRKIQFDKSGFGYHNLFDSLKFTVNLGKLRVDVDKNNLDSLKFDIDKVLLANTRVSLIIYNRIKKTEEVVGKSKEKTDTAKVLQVTLKRIDLNAVTFIQSDSLTKSGGSYTIGEAQILPRLIDLKKQIIQISSIRIQKGIIDYTASSLVTEEPEELPAKTTKSQTSWKIKLDKSDLAFDRVRLKNLVPADSSLSYLSDISLSNININLSAWFNNSKLWNAGINSLRFTDNRTSRLISMTAAANSDGKLIRVSPLQFRLGGSYISAVVSGEFGNQARGTLPDFNVSIASSRLLIDDFELYLPKSIYPNLNRIPSQLNLAAELKSRNQLLEGSGELKTKEGNIRFTADMKQAGSNPLYHFTVGLTELNGGFFARNQELGKVNAIIDASGSGFKPDSMNTDLSVHITSIAYKTVDYNDIKLQGKINQGNLNALMSINDPLARLQLKVNGKLSNQPEFRINTHIQNLDLYAMKLIEDTIAFSGIIDASYRSKGEGRFIASTDTLKVNVRTPKDEINTESKLFYSVLGDSVEARVKSNFGNIAYDGNIPLQEIPAVMKNYFSQYFSEEKADSAQNSGKYFKLDINVEDLTMLNDFLAIQIDVPENAKLSARLSNNQLFSDVDIEKLIFNEFEIDKLKLTASGKDSSFVIGFKTDALHNKIHTIRELALDSKLTNGALDSRLSFSNAVSQKWFNIGVSMEPQNPELNLVIEEPLLLNHQSWNVDAENRTFIKNKNVVFNNVSISSGDKMISLLSDAQRPEKLTASFKNLTFALLSEVLYGDTSYLSGKIDGELMATYLFAKPLPVFDARLGISNIILEKRPLGELSVMASNTENNEVANLNVNFGQENMRFKLDGTYGLTPNVPMNLNLSTQNLSLAALQPLIKNLITDAGGAINASLNLKGSFAEPQVNGEIGFDKAMAFIEPIQAKFQIDNQKILFRGSEVNFNNFTVKDDDGDPLEINGKVALANLKKLYYNLDINTEEFLAYQGPPDNLPGQDNRLILTSNIKLTGEDKTPNVTANITIDEGSRFFYKITKQASTLTEEGVIEFDGYKEPEESVSNQSIAQNLSLTANISVAPNTAVKIITDPVRNLGLNMIAGGTFSMSQRPYQSPNLNGRLDISGGDYTISLSGLKRKFQIADSSYIVWYGNISKPELNLRAYYEVRTSPAELLGTQQTSSTLPFMVNMMISGSLEDPKFNFRLSLPREYEGVENGMVASKLQEINSNESELNQMAMTLLLFGSFGFNNFANVLGNNGGANVLISNALNQFAAQKLKFVDLHFDLESYDNYGSESQDNLRTEMKIAASKKLADDRLNIAIGATVVLQADEQEQQKSISERISPEFNIEYKVNKPRNLSVRTFRRSEYRGLVEGKVISTGAGILFQKDFNKLKELFKKPEEPEPVAENQESKNGK